MSLLVYKIVHLLGLFLLFVALGALAANGEATRRQLMAIHGVGLALILISGFGMIAKLGVGFPLWVWLKLAIWLIMGGVVVLIRRRVQPAVVWWLLLPILGTVAGYLAIYKPW